MKIDLPPIPDAERTPLVEALLGILDAQQQRIQQLEETVGKLRDEIALLQGEKPRPTIKPSRLEAPPAKPPPAPGDKRPGSHKRSKTGTFLAPIEVKIPFPDAGLAVATPPRLDLPRLRGLLCPGPGTPRSGPPLPPRTHRHGRWPDPAGPLTRRGPSRSLRPHPDRLHPAPIPPLQRHPAAAER